jgi:uncharacterized protein (DUF2249 family)
MVRHTLRCRRFRQLDAHQEKSACRESTARFAELDAHQGVQAPGFQQCGDECQSKPAALAIDALMAREFMLDVRGMEPPEPLERVLETVDAFAPGDRLKLVIDCRPLPLFKILERNGFAFREEPGAESLYEITIWRKE